MAHSDITVSEQFDSSEYVAVFAITIACGVISMGLVFRHIKMLTNKGDESLDRLLVILQALALIIASFISICMVLFLRVTLLFEFALAGAQGISVTFFVSYVLLQMGGIKASAQTFEKDPEDAQKYLFRFPVLCLAKFFPGKLNLKKLSVLRALCFQLLLWRPTVMFLALVSESYDNDVTDNLGFGIVTILSVMLGIYGMSVIVAAATEHGSIPRLGGKATLVKIFIVLAQLQPVLFSIIRNADGFSPSDTFTPDDRASFYMSMCFGIEFLLLSGYFTIAYPLTGLPSDVQEKA